MGGTAETSGSVGRASAPHGKRPFALWMLGGIVACLGIAALAYGLWPQARPGDNEADQPEQQAISPCSNPFLPDGPLRGLAWSPPGLPEFHPAVATGDSLDLADTESVPVEIDGPDLPRQTQSRSTCPGFILEGPRDARSGPQTTSGAALNGRGSGRRRAMLIRYGGTKHTERAVIGGLLWLARHQNRADGSWSLKNYVQDCKDRTCSGPGNVEADAGATGMALLPFLAAGQTHKGKGPYQRTVADGLAWLIRQQKPDGNAASGCDQMMYSHGVATMAFCEAYGLTGDPSIGRAAQAAVNFIIAAQNRQTGGWRYNPGDAGDTSVFGWQIMALKSASMAGLSTNAQDGEVFQRSIKWLDSCAKGETGGLYSYRPDDRPTPSMTAVGLLCRQHLGAKPDDPMLTEGRSCLLQNLPCLKFPNVYYWYYATQAMYFMQGSEWDQWNRAMRKLLVDLQCRDNHSCANGSWDPESHSWGRQGGRIMTTALNCLTLEVYYRYAPLFQSPRESDAGAMSHPAAEIRDAAAVPPVLATDADQREGRFLKALREAGYSDIAFWQLQHWKDRPTASKYIREYWDLEMSVALIAAARAAAQESEAKRLLAEADEHLQAFVRQRPGDLEAARAEAARADVLGEEALRVLRRGKPLTGQKQAEALQKARKALEDVRMQYVAVLTRFKAKLAATPRAVEKRRMPPAERKKLEAWSKAQSDLLQTELKIATADFCLAQTFVDANNPQRAEALKRAGRAFEKIFQENREGAWGVYSHFMHARCLQELGELETALEYYDEILAGAPEIRTEAAARSKPPVPSGEEWLFAKAQQHRLQILLDDRYKKRSPKEYYKEARQWLEPQYQPYYLTTDGYQGISFDWVKFNLSMAERTQTAASRKVYTDAAMAALNQMRKIPSEYQGEALRMLSAMGIGDADDVVEELLAHACEEAAMKNWPLSQRYCEQALGTARKSTQATAAARTFEIRTAIARCQCNVALALFHDGKPGEAATVLRSAVRDYRDTMIGPEAARLLLQVLTAEYTKALRESPQGKSAQGPRRQTPGATAQDLVKAAEWLAREWAGTPVADSARLALVRVEIQSERLDQAVALFRQLGPGSPDYGTALCLVSHAHWRKYLLAKKGLEAKIAAGGKPVPEEQQSLALWRSRAAKGLERALPMLKTLPADKHGRLARRRFDVQLLLAEMRLEGGDFKEAASLLQPLLDEVQTACRENGAVDPASLQVIADASWARLGLNQVDAAGTSAELLARVSPDSPQYNLLLLEVTRRLAVAAGEAKQDTVILRRLLQAELPRPWLASAAGNSTQVAALAVLAHACVLAGLVPDAEKLHERLLLAAHRQDAESRPAIQRWALLQRLALLRANGREAESRALAAKLVKDHPRWLEARMELGYTVRALADKDPARSDEAAGYWSDLHQWLAELPQVPPEHYEVIWQWAATLGQKAKQTADESARKQACELLEGVLQDAAKPGDRRLRAQYRELLAKLRVPLRR